MINVVFFQEFLHVCVVKFFSHIGLQIFRISSIILNYLCDRCSHLISTLGFQQYSPCILTQHIDNGENVVTFVESCKSTSHHISLLQVIVSIINYDTSAWKIFSRRSVQFFHQSPLFEAFLLKHVTLCYDYCCIMHKISQSSYENIVHRYFDVN